MDRGGLEQSLYLVSFLQPHLLAGLLADEGLEDKAAVQHDLNHRPLSIERMDASGQAVARAGLGQQVSTCLNISSNANRISAATATRSG